MGLCGDPECDGFCLRCGGVDLVAKDPGVDVERHIRPGELQVQVAFAGEPGSFGVLSRARIEELHNRPCRLHATPDRTELWLIIQGPTTIRRPKETTDE